MGCLEPGEPARFHTASGLLTVISPDGERLTMDFPAAPPTPVSGLRGLAEALGAEPVWVGRSRSNVLAELADEKAVRAVAPDAAAISAVEALGIIVTARATGGAGYDFVSRYFTPAQGVLEDPVTGSAHCALAPYWAGKLGCAALVGHQASARGGIVGVRVRGDRVDLTGRAVTVLRGELMV
jgi:predicted PhzF superfamily epimerase YddE/YHI9